METSSKSSLASGIHSSSGPSGNGISTTMQIALAVCAALLVILVGITSAGVAEIHSIDVCEVAPTQNEFLATSSVYGGPKNCSPFCNSVNTTNLEDRVVLNFALLSSLFGPFRSVRDSTTAEMVLLSNNQGVITGSQPVICNYTFSTDAVATVFKYSSGQYERVVTTVPQEDGTFAACTTLATDSSAYAALENNEEFIGTTTLFNQVYMTKYAPILDASTGQRVGALFVGVLVN
jgi:hypothetical protein